MNYVIKNNKNVHIRLNSNGTPVACTEDNKTLFEYSKACNIIKMLPKVLKRMNFKIEAVPDLFPEKKIINSDPSKKVIQKSNYIISDNIKQWIEKFGICDDILKEAKERREELYRELSEVDKWLNDYVHNVELNKTIDMYSAWLERKKLYENRNKRREIKDEIIILSNILRMDFRDLDRDIINKAIEGLANRKYTFRVVEEDELNAM